MAMLHLAVAWGQADLSVVTVDHGLRPEAANEAQLVADTCASLGVSHTLLRWQGWDGAGNLQDRARAARYGLISDWAASQGIDHVLLAHTIEDQAETFLMRLARASGVDGLSAMEDRVMAGVRFHRPLLRAKRRDLRLYLEARGQKWADDPSNADKSYDRVRLRARAEELAQIGLDAQTLYEVAQNMAQAKEALNWAGADFARVHAQMQGPDLTLGAEAFAALPVELKRRVLVAALRWMSGADYAPRRAAVAGMLQALNAGQGATLHGCRVTQRKGRLWLFREYAAVAQVQALPGQTWDRRWVLSGPAQAGDRVAALGPEGAAQLSAARDPMRPAAALQADPGVWRDGQLIAAPFSGLANGWHAQPAADRTDFVSALSTH
ncbi:tRNA lysidine(34) synthetase TilS [Thalassovita sp.]|uniref:tRNA lysidine(34) synthetase TilS n=1 Tax=Thalassovita sp. TaxID=1979401 RepID=UPI003B5A3928